MKKSTLFVGRSNYQLKSVKQYQKELKHILRLIETKNIDISKSKSNQYFFYENNELVNTNNLSNEELYTLILKNLELTIQNYKDKNHNSKEVQEKNNQLIEQRRNTKNRLNGKDLTLEDFENSNLSAEDYINQNWTKQYKSENMTNRMKKRTLESLEKYINLKNEITLKDKDLKISGFNTLFQELVIKVPISNGVDFTINELQNIIDNQIKKEKDRGNEVVASFIHNDESSKHCHILIKSNDFKLLQNQQNDILKKYNLDYDLDNLSKEQLKKLGELEQSEDYKLVNSSMKQEISFDLVHNINDDITNEERIENNRLINKKNSYTNIDNRVFNNVNLEIQNNLKKSKELFLVNLENNLQEVKLKIKEETINFNSSYKTTITNDLKSSNGSYFTTNYFTSLKNTLIRSIKEFSGKVHKSVLEEVQKIQGRSETKKLKDKEFLNKLINQNQKFKKYSDEMDELERRARENLNKTTPQEKIKQKVLEEKQRRKQENKQNSSYSSEMSWY